MSLATFIPKLVLANMVLRARKNLVAAGFCNTSVTVELKEKGDKLTINTLGEVSTQNTSESTPMTYGDVSSTGTDLEITLDKTVSLKIKDKEKAQIAASGQALEAAYAARMIYVLNDDIDQLVLGKHANMTDTYETGTTPWQWGAAAADVPAFFAAGHKAMDDANCENTDRFMCLPNIAIQGIRLYLSGRQTNIGDAAVRPGLAFNEPIYGFWVFQSPNCAVVSTTVHGIMGNMPNIGEGVPGGIALAVQISPMIEKLRLEGFWADGLRARATAGAAVFKSDRVFDINLNTNLLA
jgi:hypothetical protein